MAAQDSIIYVKNCSYKTQNKTILKNISFKLYPGQCHYLLGNNGIGKTVLFDLISGVYKPAQGSIERALPLDHIAYLTQNLRLPYLLSVKEAVLFIGSILQGVVSVGFDTLYQQMHPATQKVIDKTARQRASKCSVGEKWLILANLFFLSPRKDVFILDEPTAGLSPENRAVLYTIFEDALKKGKTLLISTHIQEDIESQASHIIQL